MTSIGEDRHRLEPGGLDRESLVWTVPLPELGLAVVAYTWVDGRDRAGAAAIVFGSAVGEQIFEIVDGIDVGAEASFTDWSVGPLHVATGPSGSWDVRYRGDEVDITLTFAGSHPDYPYSNHPRGCPSFFAADRVEQTGRVTGTARIRDRTVAIDALGQRDHSWGTRDWAAMTHMKWLNVMTPDAAVHLVELQALGQTHLPATAYGDASWETCYLNHMQERARAAT